MFLDMVKFHVLNYSKIHTFVGITVVVLVPLSRLYKVSRVQGNKTTPTKPNEQIKQQQ